MWWLIFVVAFVFGFILSWKEEDFYPLLSCLFIALIVLVALGGISNVHKIVVKEYEEEQYKIQGLENNITTSQNTNGAFILGFGYINSSTKEEMKYYYFKVNDIGKKLETIEITNNSDTYIRETDEIKPCLIYRYQETLNKGFWKWLFGENRQSTKIAEILVVPKNTIKIEYNVEI